MNPTSAAAERRGPSAEQPAVAERRATLGPKAQGPSPSSSRSAERRVDARGALVVAVAVIAAACGRAAPPPGAAPEEACMAVATPAARGPVMLGLLGTVDQTRAPIPATAAEAFLFRQLYEPLVWRDCAGRLHPALAASWHTPDGGRRWLLTLQGDARFWNGQPVRAEDVLSAWGRHESPGVAVAAANDSTVAVTFSEALDTPWPLADPAFSVAAPGDAGGWPLGTTPPGHVRHVASDDARDLLDGGADAVVTRDPQVASYARGLGGYVEIPLPWDRVYLLLNGDPLLPDDGDLTAGFVAAVTTFARAPDPPFWWSRLDVCGYLSPRVWTAGTTVAYTRDDAVARALAARVVAVSPRRGLRTTPRDDADRAGAIVRALPRTPFRPCDVARELGLTRQAPPLRALIETRAVLLVRRAAAPAMVVEWDGMPRVPAPGR